MEAASVGPERRGWEECQPGYMRRYKQTNKSDNSEIQSNKQTNGEMSEDLYDYDEMLQIDLDYYNQFDHLFNDTSGTDSFRFARNIYRIKL